MILHEDTLDQLTMSRSVCSRVCQPCPSLLDKIPPHLSDLAEFTRLAPVIPRNSIPHALDLHWSLFKVTENQPSTMKTVNSRPQHYMQMKPDHNGSSISLCSWYSQQQAIHICHTMQAPSTMEGPDLVTTVNNRLKLRRIPPSQCYLLGRTHLWLGIRKQQSYPPMTSERTYSSLNTKTFQPLPLYYRKRGQMSEPCLTKGHVVSNLFHMMTNPVFACHCHPTTNLCPLNTGTKHPGPTKAHEHGQL